jgi:hypothetical protein
VIVKRWIFTAAIAATTCTASFGDAISYQAMSLPELLYRLPMLMKKSVEVEGTLTAWGDLAALNSDVSREVMVDLRKLPDDLREKLNSVCAVDHACLATVRGSVQHLRGEGFSELGVEATEIDFTPASAQ